MTYPCPIVEEPFVPWRAAATTHFNATTAGTTLSYLFPISTATLRSLLHTYQSPKLPQLTYKYLGTAASFTTTPRSQQHVVPGQSPGPGLPTRQGVVQIPGIERFREADQRAKGLRRSRSRRTLLLPYLLQHWR